MQNLFFYSFTTQRVKFNVGVHAKVVTVSKKTFKVKGIRFLDVLRIKAESVGRLLKNLHSMKTL